MQASLTVAINGAPDVSWKVFGTTSAALENMVRHQSPFGHLKGWKLAHFIVKAGDDFRMEALAMQVQCWGAVWRVSFGVWLVCFGCRMNCLIAFAFCCTREVHMLLTAWELI